MSGLFALALAPVFICAVYVFIRDKYEKEPIDLLVTGVLYGVVITVPIVHTENFAAMFVPNAGWFAEVFYDSFIVASLVEEGYKFLVLFFLTWANRNLNERFDGIVYGVFISLGFAGLENVLYVFNPTMGGFHTGVMRAIISVPGHALFGVTMGYYFALMKFVPQKTATYTLYAFAVPWALHGAFDFILLSNAPYTMAIFIPFVVWLWVIGFRRMRTHIANSPFRPAFQAKKQ